MNYTHSHPQLGAFPQYGPDPESPATVTPFDGDHSAGIQPGRRARSPHVVGHKR